MAKDCTEPKVDRPDRANKPDREERNKKKEDELTENLLKHQLKNGNKTAKAIFDNSKEN